MTVNNNKICELNCENIIFGLCNWHLLNTLHSAGYIALSQFMLESNKIDLNMHAQLFYLNKKTFIVILKSFMNISGEVLKNTLERYKLYDKVKNITILYDDLFTEIGKIKKITLKKAMLSKHNGVKNCIINLSDKNLSFIKIGVLLERLSGLKNIDKVLSNFNEDEKSIIKNINLESALVF